MEGIPSFNRINCQKHVAFHIIPSTHLQMNLEESILFPDTKQHRIGDKDCKHESMCTSVCIAVNIATLLHTCEKALEQEAALGEMLF